MNKTTATKRLSFILCLALIAAIALTAMGCDQAKTPETPDTTAGEADTANLTVKGEGATVFYFNVVDGDGNETKFEIHTDKTMVGISSAVSAYSGWRISYNACKAAVRA